MLNDLNPETFTRVYISCGYTDLRYGINHLAGIVESEFQMIPFEKNVLYLFCGRKSDRIKGLIWEGD